MREETDKFREDEGRKAAKKGKDSQFLNGEGLEDDLVSEKEVKTTDTDVDEWDAREDQNRH